MKRLILIFSTLFILLLSSCNSASDECSKNSDCSSEEVCSENKCISPEISPTLTFQNISDGIFLNAYEYDEDLNESGVQVSLLVQATDILDGTVVELQKKGDDSSKASATLDNGRAIFRAFSLQELEDGEAHILFATALDKYGRTITTGEISVYVKDYKIEITSPLSNLKVEDDNNPDKFYIQKDVTVEVSGVNNGVNIKLSVYNAQTDSIKAIYFSNLDNGAAIFPDVDFPAGDWKLIASFQTLSNVTVNSEAITLTADPIPGNCEVNIIPSTGTIINQAYLKDNNIENKIVPLRITSNCPEGFSVTFIANKGAIDEETILTTTLREENGSSVAETSYSFKEDKEREGLSSKISVEIVNLSNTSEGGSAESVYTVDTIGPQFLSMGFPTEGTLFYPDNDRDSETPGMQFITSGSTDDATGTLYVSVDGGVEQEFTGAFNSEGEFNTQELQNPYVTILTSGEKVLTYKAYDSFGNEGTKTVNVKVYSNEVGISFESVASISITNEERENGVKLNQTNDANSDIPKMQLSIIAASNELEIGKGMALYINGGKYAESIIGEDNRVIFNLDTESTGLNNGIYSIYVTTLDNSGVVSETLTLYISNSKPTLLLSNHENGDYLNTSPISLDISTTGLNNSEIVTLSQNGGELISTESLNNHAIFLNITLQNGENQFIVNTTDFAGNTAETLTFSLFYDPELPVLSLLSPTDGSTLIRADDTNSVLPGIQTIVTISASNELEGIEGNIYLNYIDENSTPIATTTLNSEKHFVFEDVSLASGSTNQLKVIAIDRAGNSSELDFSLIVDDGCYNLGFLSPTTNGAYLNDSSFVGNVNIGASGTTNIAPENLSLTLSINGDDYNTLVNTSGVATFTSVTLLEGSNTLVVSYDVDASTSCQFQATLTYDTTEPVISKVEFLDKNSTKLEILNGATFYAGNQFDRLADSGSQVRVIATVTGVANGQTATLKSNGIDIATSTINCVDSVCTAIFNPTFNEGGPYALSITAKDRSNNTSSPFIINLNVDLTTPIVAFDANFPASLNTSNVVDRQPLVAGVQYNVLANLSNIQAGDIVRFYVNGSLATMRLDSDLNTPLSAEKTLTVAQTTYTFPNVTFPVCNSGIGCNPDVGYEISLIVLDQAGNTTQVIKQNYKVLDEFTVQFNDGDLIAGTKRTNQNQIDILTRINRAETGVLTLKIAKKSSPSTIINTQTTNFNGTQTSHTFTLTNTLDIPDNDRYILTLSFTDQSGFVYNASQNGYLAVKRTTPSVSQIVVMQDVNSDKKLIKAEDGNATTTTIYESSITVTTTNLYLDAEDYSAQTRAVELRKDNSLGTLIGSGTVIRNGDGTETVTLNGSFPEGNYSVVALLTDRFTNSSNSSVGTYLVDITAPTISGMYTVNTSTSAEKYFTNNIKYLVSDDSDFTTSGLQTELKVNATGVGSTGNITVSTSPIGFTKSVTSTPNTTTLGVVTIPDNTYSFTITATDFAGNPTTLTYTGVIVDTAAPKLDLAVSGGPNFVDADDVDSTTAGFQVEVTVSNMQNIEEGRVVNIISNLSGSDIIVGSFTKDASNSKTLNITLSSGTGVLKATTSDVNGNSGTSASVSISVALSSCSFNFVKKGTTTLQPSPEKTYFNSNDIVGGNVVLTIDTTVACTGNSITIKKGGTTVRTEALTLTTQNFNIPISNGDDTTLQFSISSLSVDSSVYNIIGDIVAPTVSRSNPSLENITYVNSENPSVGGAKIADSNGGTAGAQVTIDVRVQGAQDGSVELIANDGLIDTSLGFVDTIISDDEVVSFTGKTLAHNKTHTIRAVVKDAAQNETTSTLYTAVVDVINPASFTTFEYSDIFDNTGISFDDTERRKADLSLAWNRVGDDDSTGNIAKYTIKYTQALFVASDFETLTGAESIDVTDSEAVSEILTGLTFHKNYTIGIRAYDEVGNASDVSVVTLSDDLMLKSRYLGTNDADTVMAFRNLGDINGDGYDDFAIGQPYGNGFDGSITIFYGSNDPSQIGEASKKQAINGIGSSFESFGRCFASGDFDGDGNRDLLVGVEYGDYFFDNGFDNFGGEVRVYYGQGGGQNINPLVMTSIMNSGNHNNTKVDIEDDGAGYFYGTAKFGISCDVVGDIDGDGKDDFIIGESAYTVSASQKGRAFVIKGRSGRVASIDVNGDSSTLTLNHNFGSITNFASKGLAGIGDLDGDGVLDVAVGDSSNKKVAIYHLTTNISGSLTTTDSNVVVLNPNAGGEPYHNFGEQILSNTDLDGDSNSDLVIGQGASVNPVIYYGIGSRFTATKTPDARIGGLGQTNLGVFIDSADLNGDGKKDLIVGATDNVNIFLSGTTRFSSLVSMANVTLTRASDFTESTSTALFSSIGVDINSDGIFDIISIDGNNSNRMFLKY
ncbi:FG-GAP repeat protein [bacterium]|nr:FG-GAP repeat protein [bacterium]